MKKLIVVFLVCTGWHSLLAQKICGTDEMMRQLIKKDPSLKVRMEQYDEKIRLYTSSRSKKQVQRDAQNPYIIPVVVHIVKDGTGGVVDENKITKQDIKTAIANMNTQYAGTGIQFGLAPNGANTEGIEYIDASTNVNYKNNGVGGAGITDVALKNLGRWPPGTYYNIWVVNKIADDKNLPLNGYSFSPKVGGGIPPEVIDGTVIDATSMKDPKGATLSHETGHFFGLEHVFEGQQEKKDANGNVVYDAKGNVVYDCPPQGDPGDGIADTDPVTQSYDVRSGTNPCTGTPYTNFTENNIMSYTNDRTTFTPGQKDIMMYIIETYRRRLAGLPPLPDTEVKKIGPALSKSDKQIRGVASIDPNEKVGITTNTAANHVNAAAPFSYNIYFENKNTATAPAQEVVIIDTLDKSKFDLATFQLNSFGYSGSSKAYIPAGFTAYFSVDTLRRSGKPNLLVKTDAKLDTVNGILTWRFLSLDPQTRELLADPLDGFLPPNITSPQGEGFVSYSISPKAGLPHGTAIKNMATIYFDNNAPITTNVFLNTLDKVSPVSAVNPIPAEVHDPVFTVQWSGNDNGAGIRSYDIYYKVNNGSYQLWQYDVTATGNSFFGQVDSVYSFFSIAKDYAGNIEAAKQAADQTVAIKIRDSAYKTCSGANTSFTINSAGAGFMYQWQVNQGTGFTDLQNDGTYSGTKTLQLILNNLSTPYRNFKYRCKISSGNATYYSSVYAVKFENTWLGTSGNAWETPANWSCGTIPDAYTDVVIPKLVPANPVVNQTATCKSITLSKESNLQVKSGVNIIITGKQ
ncbi:MAG: M43 family zinc metalloprotease [Ferruginibacter sp.]